MHWLVSANTSWLIVWKFYQNKLAFINNLTSVTIYKWTKTISTSKLRQSLLPRMEWVAVCKQLAPMRDTLSLTLATLIGGRQAPRKCTLLQITQPWNISPLPSIRIEYSRRLEKRHFWRLNSTFRAQNSRSIRPSVTLDILPAIMWLSRRSRRPTAGKYPLMQVMPTTTMQATTIYASSESIKTWCTTWYLLKTISMWSPKFLRPVLVAGLITMIRLRR